MLPKLSMSEAGLAIVVTALKATCGLGQRIIGLQRIMGMTHHA